MSAERRLKIFRNSRNRVVRIPREFEFPGKDAMIRKEGKRLIIDPAPRKSLPAVLKTLRPVDEDIPARDDSPPEPVEI